MPPVGGVHMRSIALSSLVLVSLVTAACASSVGDVEDEGVDDTSGGEAQQALSGTSSAAPLTQMSGAWWNDRSMFMGSQQIDEVWAEVRGAVPDHKITGPLDLTIACHLPLVAGNTLKVTK